MGSCHKYVMHVSHVSLKLFQIDTTGCMEVVRERKAQSSALLQTSAQDPGPGLLQVRSRGERWAQASSHS